MHRISLLLVFLFVSYISYSQDKPADHFGFQPGSDFNLADYSQLLSYYKHLADNSDRVILQEIGQSELGRPLLLLTVSSKDNINNLEKYKRISREQALAKIGIEQSKANAQEGKAVVWIDAGLHASERATAQMMPLLAYDLATSESDEFKNIRENVITLIMPEMNPDGLDIIASWYKENLGTPYETTSPPWLYHHYVGHDNNRDWFMNNMSETRAVNKILYQEWFPQIVHNHHQTSPSWARIFVPPFASPVNPRIHPAIVSGTNMVGMAMANRFALKEMPGVVSNYRFSMWWNGGMRTVPYFHNMIGILTETAHATPTPRQYPKDSVPKMIGGQYPTDGSDIFYPNPWKGGESKFADAVSYMYEASMAILNLATERRESYLQDIYTLGVSAIEDDRNPIAYIFPKDQKDFSEAIDLANILMLGGIEIQELKEKASIQGKDIKEGSLVIYGNQSFSPYIRDLLEKQEYPIQKKYPGGPVKTPYDLAGWTLPLQMGVEVVKLESANNPSLKTTVLTSAITKSSSFEEKGKIILFRTEQNDSYKLINRSLNEGVKVSVNKSENLFFIDSNEEEVKTLSNGLQIDFIRKKEIDQAEFAPIERKKVGLYKSWIANMDEGWTRWVLTQYEFDWDTLHNEDLLTKDLSSFDAIIIPDQSESRIMNGYSKGTMPRQYTGGIGLEGSMKLQKFVADGGTLIGFDKACNYMIQQFGLPVKNVTKGLSTSKFFIPGSLMGIQVDTDQTIATGMLPETVASFSRSSAFDIVKKSYKGEGGNEPTVTRAPLPSVEIIARYLKNDGLKSGYAMNPDKYIGGKIAAAAIPEGDGAYVLIGFRPQFRGQAHTTYKLIFNSILLGGKSGVTSSD